MDSQNINNVMVFGFGNIGTTLVRRLQEEGIHVKYIVKSDFILDSDLNGVARQCDWEIYAKKADCAFICIPTVDKGEQAAKYQSFFLKKGKPVITCEKASIAHHWNSLKKQRNIFKYTASVGGGTKMLEKISNYKPKDIRKIKAVVNGTLNYISENLGLGLKEEEIIKIVLERGYAEPGATSFDEIILSEMKDVILKTMIIANHSGIFKRTIKEKDIHLVNFHKNMRCIVEITHDTIKAGFIEGNLSYSLPSGVNNVLYVNGEKKASGLGAGAEATVSSMMSDYASLK